MSWTLGPDAVVMCHGTSRLNALRDDAVERGDVMFTFNLVI